MSGRFPKREWTGPYVGWGALDSNHHGPRVDGEATTLRSTFLICYLDNGLMPPPRYFWGVRLWVYAPSGRCWNLDLCWRSSKRHAESEREREARAIAYVEQQKARGEWPPKGAMGPDYLGAMLGASGLGLKVRWEPVLDDRVRPFHGLAAGPDPWVDAEPPRDLGRFNCRGEYVFPPHRLTGKTADVIIVDDSLPEGLIERDGVVMYQCRVCGEWTELPVDPSEFNPDSTTNVCGGSPRCCP